MFNEKGLMFNFITNERSWKVKVENVIVLLTQCSLGKLQGSEIK